MGWIFSQGLRCLHCCHGHSVWQLHRPKWGWPWGRARIEKGKRKEIDFVFDNVVSAFDNEPVISQFNQILIPAHPPQAADVIIRISKSASLHIMEWFGETRLGSKFFWALIALAAFKTLQSRCKYNRREDNTENDGITYMHLCGKLGLRGRVINVRKPS